MDELKGYVGLTDPDWYEYLATHPRVDEVNFWQPHGDRAFRVLKRDEPFFFKLRAPYKAIAGFGLFQRFEAMPAWQAWELFGEMNGAADFVSMLDRIVRLRGSGTPRLGDFQIGCVMLAAPVFFQHDEWVTPPADWARTGIQQGKSYSLASGEGRRLFLECMERASHGARYWNVGREARVVAEEAVRYGTPTLVRPRLGQGLFSREVNEAYRGACAVTREHSTPVLDAAHIVPYRDGGEHRVDNGLLLRSDLHRLYDHGYVTITPDYVFRVGDSLREEYHNGRSYYGLNGQPILLPEHTALRPNREFLEWHQQNRFKG